jgi:hypothetical protein
MSEKSLKQESTQMGKTVIVRPSKLAAEGTTGTVAEGVLEKVEPNKFDASKSDYFIRGADDTLYILNETKALKDQLGQPELIGKRIRVSYEGKMKTKNGKGFHDFSCFLVG